MMKELVYKAELLDDIVLSQRTATAGDHKSLDYIPGSTVLGAFAGLFYSECGPDKAWDIFNSSKVCFCNAYPLINGKRSVPMPLSFHSEKVPSKGKEKEVLNFVFDKEKKADVQYRQLRAGYVDFSTSKMNTCSVSKTCRMRTTIDAKTGSAAKSQLYGYESIDAGQVFAGKILWDESMESLSECEEILNAFRQGTVLHIGRSKTASYGRVKVSLLDVSSSAQKPAGTSFSILAVSDLCLRNPVTGKAELQLQPECLGLSSDWKIDMAHTFIRPNTIFQYNAFRRELETQKTLITKGSVVTFTAERALSAEEIASISEKLVSGIGTARGQGYGEIALLNLNEKYEKTMYSVMADKDFSLTAEEKGWLDWLASFSDTDDVEHIVMPAVKDFKILCRYIKTFNKFQNDDKFWPSKTQWNRIRDILSGCSEKKAIKAALFEGENPVIKAIKVEHTQLHGDKKVKNPDIEWNYEDSKGKTLRKWLMEYIETLNDSNIQNALLELTKRCQNIVEKPNWLEEAR